MASLSSDNPWRQGCLLKDEDAKNLGILDPNENDKKVLLVSHDCDVFSDQETTIEVLVCQVVNSPDGNFRWNKNPRRLHLIFNAPEDQKMNLDVTFHRLERIPDSPLLHECVPDSKFWLTYGEKYILKLWLAGRYGRSAFPNAFETRLKNGSVSDFVKEIERTLKDPEGFIVTILFDLGEGRGRELPDDKPYELEISVVYDLENGAKAAEDFATQAAEKLKTLFHRSFGEVGSADQIILFDCSAIADDYVSFGHLRRADPWRLEHISLRNGTPNTDASQAEETPKRKIRIMRHLKS
jgi:hypothetical protein